MSFLRRACFVRGLKDLDFGDRLVPGASSPNLLRLPRSRGWVPSRRRTGALAKLRRCEVVVVNGLGVAPSRLWPVVLPRIRECHSYEKVVDVDSVWPLATMGLMTNTLRSEVQ